MEVAQGAFMIHEYVYVQSFQGLLFITDVLLFEGADKEILYLYLNYRGVASLHRLCQYDLQFLTATYINVNAQDTIYKYNLYTHMLLQCIKPSCYIYIELHSELKLY